MKRKPGPRSAKDLSANRIVAVGLELADREGPGAVTFRRLARELDVTPMALYTHVRGKADLLNMMADAVLTEIELPDNSELSWDEKLRRGLRSVHEVVDRHPSAGALIARPLASPAAMRLSERLLAILAEAGFDDEQASQVLQVITGMILGPVVLAAGYGRFAGQSEESAGDEWERYSAFLGGTSFGDYPHLVRALPAIIQWGSQPELMNRIAVDVLIEGLRSLVARQD